MNKSSVKKVEKKPSKNVKKKKKKEEKPVKEKETDKALFDALNEPEVEEKPVDPEKKGYNKKEREELDKLFLESLDEGE